jgi:3-hydroxyisobutyrate dehydrogenase-like beta-hydroxyacid dehydrogenase
MSSTIGVFGNGRLFMNKAGLIGLGAMGSGIAATLRAKGYDMHVCDAREGVAPAVSPARRRPTWQRRATSSSASW